MLTHQIKDRIQMNVSFSKSTALKIRSKAKELGVTQSRLINTIVHNELALVTVKKSVTKKAAKK